MREAHSFERRPGAFLHPPHSIRFSCGSPVPARLKGLDRQECVAGVLLDLPLDLGSSEVTHDKQSDESEPGREQASHNKNLVRNRRLLWFLTRAPKVSLTHVK